MALDVQHQLTPAERERLSDLEATIERGLRTFVEVGLALAEVRDSHLYRETHGTFDAYCEERWPFGGRRARQIMASAEIGTMVPVANERQARELVPVLRNEGEAAVIEAYRELQADYGPDAVTAKQIKLHITKREERKRREAARKEMASRPLPPLPPHVDLRLGDFREVLADVRDVDLVYTDPPYLKEYMPIFSDVGEWAAQALKPGALLALYPGHYHLPEAMQRLGEHLEYVWQGAIFQPDARTVVHNRKVFVRWKPILFYSRGEYARRRWLEDAVVSGPRTEESKQYHDWQQDAGPPAHFFKCLTVPGDLVADPFVGSGTFAAVAKELGLRFAGAESDPDAYNIAVQRVSGDPTA